MMLYEFLIMAVKKLYCVLRPGVNAKPAKAIALAVQPPLQEWLAKLPPEKLHAA